MSASSIEVRNLMNSAVMVFVVSHTKILHTAAVQMICGGMVVAEITRNAPKRILGSCIATQTVYLPA